MIRSHFLLLLVFGLGFVSLLAGCGSGVDSYRTSVEGTVTYQGKPLESGTIQFIPTKGVTGKPVALKITAGKYSSSKDKGPAIGLNKVVIRASRKTGKQVENIMGEMEDEIIQYLPAKFNENTTLEVTLEAGKNVGKDFPLSD